MINKADHVIIGGGVNGCAIAYYLAKKGAKNIILLEKDFLTAGATGRCGGGIRQQWSTEANCILAKQSVELFEKLDEELQCNTEYFQGGYLILAYTDKEVDQFKKNVEMQKNIGLPVRLIDPKEAKELSPVINIDNVLAATYCPTDGHANPFLITKGYADAASRLGVNIELHTKVTDIKVKNDKVIAVQTDKGLIETNCVINAAGGFSQDIAKMVNIDIPTKPYRHEALITESVEKLFPQLVISFKHHIYFRQTMHGSILMGLGDPNEPTSYNIDSSEDFLRWMSKRIIDVAPALKDLNIVRQWAGLYNVTPDAQPIIGGVKEVKGYYQSVGYSGHGLMLSPQVSLEIADLILNGNETDNIKRLSLDRFNAEGITLQEDVNVV